MHNFNAEHFMANLQVLHSEVYEVINEIHAQLWLEEPAQEPPQAQAPAANQAGGDAHVAAVAEGGVAQGGGNAEVGGPPEPPEAVAEGGEQGEPVAQDDETDVERIIEESHRRDRMERAIRQMIRSVVFALEYLGAATMSKSFQTELDDLIKGDKNGVTCLRSKGDEENHLYSPVATLVWDYARAIANCFEFEYGHEFEMKLLEGILRRTRYIIKFRGVRDPEDETDVRNAIHDFLRVLYDDVVKDPHIGQPGKVYKPDIGIRHLKAAVEYKFADDAKEVNTTVDGIYADLPAYRGTRDWTKFFAVIYMTDEHVPIHELEKRFETLPENWKLIPVIGKGERKKRPKKAEQAGD